MSSLFKMADEYVLLILWTFFSGFVIVFYLWKRHKALTRQGNTQEKTGTTESVQEARLKRFKFEEKVDCPCPEPETKSKEEKLELQKQNESIPETTFRKRKGKGKEEQLSANEKVIHGPSAAVEFDEQTVFGRHFDLDTGSPITQPLKTLEEALSWRPGYDEFNIARVMLPSGYHRDNRPRTLVCHDMKGGYIEDR